MAHRDIAGLGSDPAFGALTAELLAWVAARPRTYAETMEAWRTSCPRMPVWENALSEHLVGVSPSPGAGMNGASVTLTQLGLDRLAVHAERGAATSSAPGT
jgi:hypothetical protein